MHERIPRGFATAAPMRSTEAMNGAATRTRIAICVPVRDEFDSLPALLDAFSKQTAARDCFVVCLLFDGCLDGGQTYADARAPLLDYTLVSERIERQTVANAGRARRAAMALGTRTLAETRRGGDIELAQYRRDRGRCRYHALILHGADPQADDSDRQDAEQDRTGKASRRESGDDEKAQRG